MSDDTIVLFLVLLKIIFIWISGWSSTSYGWKPGKGVLYIYAIDYGKVLLLVGWERKERRGLSSPFQYLFGVSYPSSLQSVIN